LWDVITLEATSERGIKMRGLSMQLATGKRLQSDVCETEVVVVHAPEGVVELWCGGEPMVEVGTAPDRSNPPASGQNQGTVLGKRYTHVASGLEVLCTKPGAGSLSVAGRALEVLAAKPLPSSD
jgi:hypothetical protein